MPVAHTELFEYPPVGYDEVPVALESKYPVWVLDETGRVKEANLLAFWVWDALDPVNRVVQRDRLLGQFVFQIMADSLSLISIRCNIDFFLAKFCVLKKFGQHPSARNIAEPFARFFQNFSDLRELYLKAPLDRRDEGVYPLRIANPAPRPADGFLNFATTVNRIIKADIKSGFLVQYQGADEETATTLNRQFKVLKQKYRNFEYVQRSTHTKRSSFRSVLPRVEEHRVKSNSSDKNLGSKICVSCQTAITCQETTRVISRRLPEYTMLYIHAPAYVCDHCNLQYFTPEIDAAMRKLVSAHLGSGEADLERAV